MTTRHVSQKYLVDANIIFFKGGMMMRARLAGFFKRIGAVIAQENHDLQAVQKQAEARQPCGLQGRRQFNYVNCQSLFQRRGYTAELLMREERMPRENIVACKV
jgi:hypothetical protein